MADILELTTYLYPELRFSSETRQTPYKDFEHVLKMTYKNSPILLMRHIDNNSEVSKDLLDKFNIELFIQIAYSKETNGQYIDDKGNTICTFADIKNKLVMRSNDRKN